MAWTDLFRSKKTAAKPDGTIRWFGKLPTYADYYTSPTDAEWASEFNEWVLKGYEIFHARMLGRRPSTVGGGAAGNTQDVRLHPAGCVIRLPKSGMTVLASVQDYGGDMRGRHFPICFYVGVPSVVWPGPTSDRLGMATQAVQALMGLRHDVMRFFNSPGRFEAVFSKREVDLSGLLDAISSDGWRSQAGALTFSQWFDAARPSPNVEAVGQWLPLVERWGEHIAANDGSSFEPTLRFPLAMTLPLEPQLAGWMRWLEARMELQDRYLSLVVTTTAQKDIGHLTVIAREPVPDDFLLLTPLAETLPYLDSLTSVQGNGAGEAAAGTASPQRWVDFVEARSLAT
jgi:hypothetical protein